MPAVKNWRILLVQSFTARMPLLMATSTFGLGRRCWSSAQQCYLHYLHTLYYKKGKGQFSYLWRNREIITELPVHLKISFIQQTLLHCGRYHSMKCCVMNFWIADTNSLTARNRCWNPELWQWFTVCSDTKLPAYAVAWTQASHWRCRSSRCSATSCGIPVTLWPVIWMITFIHI